MLLKVKRVQIRIIYLQTCIIIFVNELTFLCYHHKQKNIV